MKKIVTYVFAGLLSFAACETTMGMNVAAIMLQQRDPRNGNTALHKAVKNGQVTFVRDFLLPLCTANDINAVNNDGCTALRIAAKNGELDIFNLLLGHPGVKINIADNNGETPLHLAIKNWHNNIADVLILTPGIDVNALNTAGRSPLSLAAEKGNTEIVQLLLAHSNIDTNKTDGFSNSAIHYAVDKANPDEEDIKTALLLINDGRVNVNSEPNPLSTAMSHQNMTIIKALLNRPDLDLSREYSAIVISSALRSNIEILRLLLLDSRYDTEARVVALISIAEYYDDSWNEELVLTVLNDPHVDLAGMIDQEKGWWCPPFIQLVLTYKDNLKLFKLILQNPKIDLNKKFFPSMLGPEFEKTFDKIEHVSPFEFLIDKFDYTTESKIKDNMEYLSRLFLFRKMAPEAMLSQDALQQVVNKKYPDLLNYGLWNNIIDIAYGDKPELSMFSLLINNDDAFNVSNEMGLFHFDFLKSLVDRLCFFKEFAPKRDELQQWFNEKYPQFAASQVYQQVLEILYGPQQD